ncbi:hypothetical protein RS130_16550 [Paraglaciecola aquimarina]|uniref:Uncharacterized protein n=1 Tax=Paraglaciecola aquimarina TaxID=1235557 RepID=A0ABU3SZ65_9ALTE|nr:hypothetical protein [Paraglaciecola aquimarina]MDU0355301.1 hypothetical protein [Paraglaciecola aquimarina]
MASVHAISNSTSPVTTMQIPVSQSEQVADIDFSTPQKWTYLLANHIRFAEKQAYSIRLPKPEHHLLTLWVEKIVSNGQCARIFIEQLSMDEVSFKRIKQLCVENNVTLINLVHQTSMRNNVVQGPWSH